MVVKVKTPCIGVCSTGIGDDVCRGCKRFVHEIADWNAYSESQKQSVLIRLDSLLCQILETRLEIFDESLLMQQLKRQSVRYHREQSPMSWLYEVIKVGASQIQRLEDFGARLLPPYDEVPLPEFKRQVDEDLFVLSAVHHERYFSAELM